MKQLKQRYGITLAQENDLQISETGDNFPGKPNPRWRNKRLLRRARIAEGLENNKKQTNKQQGGKPNKSSTENLHRDPEPL